MKILRQILVALGLVPFAGATSLVTMLLVWVCWPAADDYEGALRRLTILVTGGFALSALLIGVFAFCMHRRHALRPLGIVAVVTTLVVGWLLWDEPASQMHNSPAGPDPVCEAESEAVVRWYWARDGAPPSLTFSQPRLPTGLGPDNPGEWRLFVASRADSIRTEWERCRDSQTWIAALDAFPVIGEAVATRQWRRSESPWSATVQLHCAYASVLAIEGRGDDALAVVQPVLSAARKLQPAARTRWRLLPARQAQRLCQETVTFILQAAPVSPAVLAALAPLLGPNGDLRAAWQRTLASDYETISSTFVLVPAEIDDASVRFWAHVGTLPLRCLIAPHATANIAAREFEKLAAVAAEGRGEGLRAHQAALGRELLRPAYKNALGRFFLAEFFQRNGLVRALERDGWKIEDQRRALLAEVQKKLAASGAAISPAKASAP